MGKKLPVWPMPCLAPSDGATIPLQTPGDGVSRRFQCKKKYGERFDLADAETWHEPDETTQTQQTTRKGRLLNITILAWHQMLMRGTKQQKMYRHPSHFSRLLIIANHFFCPKSNLIASTE